MVNSSQLSPRLQTTVQWLTVVPMVLFVVSFCLPAFGEYSAENFDGTNIGLMAAYFAVIWAIASLGSNLGDSLILFGAVSTNLWFPLALLFMYEKRYGPAVGLSAAATVTALAPLTLSDDGGWLLGYWMWLGSAVVLLTLAIVSMVGANFVKKPTM